MKNSRFFIFIFHFSIFSFPFFAQETQFSGTLSALAGVALPYTANSGDFVLGETKAQGELSVFAENSTLYANGFVLYDALKNHADALDFVAGNESAGIALQEAWFDYTQDFWAVRVGRQISAWGKADGLSVADVLCPQDKTQFAARTYAESRLGIDAARFSLKNETYSLDAYWIPFFTPAALPLGGASPLKKTLFGTTAFSRDDITLPDLHIKNSEYAAKLSAYWAALDISLYGFYGFDDEPFISYSLDEAGAVKISGNYEKMLMFGADAAIPLGETVLRMEAAFFPDRHFGTSAESQIASLMAGTQSKITQKHNQLKALAGIDWMPASWTITAQYYADTVFGDLSAISRERYEHCATLSVSRTFFSETLTLSLDGILGLNDFDSVLQAKCEYALSDHITLSVEGDFFNEGKNTGTYGRFKDLSCLILGGKFSF